MQENSMQGKIILAMLSSAIVASSVTVLVMLSINFSLVDNRAETSPSGHFSAELVDLRLSIKQLQKTLSHPAMSNTAMSQTEMSSKASIQETPADSESLMMPDMVMVNPTEQQNKLFEELKNSLDQPLYIQNLNLDALVKSEDMLSLPKPLQMVIVSKAIKRFNDGEVDRMTFLGK